MALLKTGASAWRQRDKADPAFLFFDLAISCQYLTSNCCVSGPTGRGSREVCVFKVLRKVVCPFDGYSCKAL